MNKSRRLVAVMVLLCMLLGMQGFPALATEGATASFTGRVIDADSKQPVSGVKVTLMTRDWEQLARAETNADGVWIARDVPKGSLYRLGFSHGAYDFESARFDESKAGTKDGAIDCGTWEGERTGVSIDSTTATTAAQQATTTQPLQTSESGTTTTPSSTGEGSDTTTQPNQEAGDAQKATGDDAWRLGGPVLHTRGGSEVLTAENRISWGPVDGATAYLFILMDLEAGVPLADISRTADTYMQLPTDRMEVGRSYRVSVAAVKDFDDEVTESIIGKPTDWEFVYVEGDLPEEQDEPTENPPPAEEDEEPQDPADPLPPLNLGVPEDAPDVHLVPVMELIDGEGKLESEISIKWKPAAGAESYDLYVGLDEPLQLVATGLTETEYTYVPHELGVYSAYVVAHVGIEQKASDRMNFQVTMGLSVLSLGLDTGTGDSVEFATMAADVQLTTVDRGVDGYFVSWDPTIVTSGTIDKYTITVKNASGTTVMGPTEFAPASSYSFSRSFTAGIAYTVRVAAFDNSATPVELQGWTGTFTPIASPTFTDLTASGYIVTGGSATWSSITGVTQYRWEVLNSAGNTVGSGVATGTSLADSTTAGFSFSGLLGSTDSVSAAYKLRVCAVGTPTANTSNWVEINFVVARSTVAIIKDFTITPTQTPYYTGQSLTFQIVPVVAGVYPSKVIVYARNKAVSTELTVSASGTFTYAFAEVGIYEVYLSSLNNMPNSQVHTLDVRAGGAVITAIDLHKKATALKIQWTAVEGATGYELTVGHMDGTSKVTYAISPTTVSTTTTALATSYEVPATVFSKIGPFYARVTAKMGSTIGDLPSADEYFDVIDGAYKTGKTTVKAANAKGYLLANTTQKEVALLSKGEEVTIIGEEGDFYYVQLGTDTNGNVIRVFVPKEALNKKSSSSSSGSSSGGSSSGGSSSGGSSGSGGAVSIGDASTASYLEALGTDELRRGTYTYLPELYQPLINSIASGEVAAKAKLELLGMCFSPLPNDLNNDEYSQARERAAWNLVPAFLVMMAADVTTDDMIGQPDAVQRIAGALVATIDELMGTNSLMEDSYKTVLQTLRDKANTLAQSGSGSVSGTRVDAAVAVMDQVLSGTSYDQGVITQVQNGLAAGAADEPYEVRIMRVLYALTDYEQTRVTTAQNALSSGSGSVSDTQAAYLDYVFAVGKLHQLSYAFGGAKADVVVKNWGAEIARLLAVNKVLNAG